jgi:hypothetical protein
MAIKTLNTRLVKIELQYRRVLKCAWCRYALEETSREEMRNFDRNPSDILYTECWHCGTQFQVSLAGLDEFDREAKTIVYTSEPSKRFTDERVHAAFFYCGLAKQKRRSSHTGNSTSVKTPASVTVAEEKRIREREEVKKRAIEFSRKQDQRIKLVANGPKFFPIDHKFQQIGREFRVERYSDGFTEKLEIDVNDQRRFDLEENLEPLVADLRTMKMRAACEVVLWGKTIPKTLSEMGRIKREIKSKFDNAVNAFRQEKNRQEEQRKQKETDEKTKCEAVAREKKERQHVQVELKTRTDSECSPSQSVNLSLRGSVTATQSDAIIKDLENKLGQFVARHNQTQRQKRAFERYERPRFETDERPRFQKTRKRYEKVRLPETIN